MKDYNIPENLETLYVSKLMEKYKKMGFEVYPEHPSSDKRVQADLYVRNPETQEQIIFEVKARKGLSKERVFDLVVQTKILQKSFPGARVQLVLAEEQVKTYLPSSILDSKLLELIRDKHVEELKKNIEGFVKLHKVESIDFRIVELGDFTKMTFIGTGTLRFFMETEIEVDAGSGYISNLDLSDGIPFNFNIQLNSKVTEGKLVHQISEGSQIIFDLREFKA